jgi:hypothetical protein
MELTPPIPFITFEKGVMLISPTYKDTGVYEFSYKYNKAKKFRLAPLTISSAPANSPYSCPCALIDWKEIPALKENLPIEL